MNVAGSFSASYSVTETFAYGLVTSDSPQSSDNAAIALANGTAAGGGVMDLHWELAGSTAVTLAAGASVTYTLSALTDGLSRAVAMAHVVAFLLRITTITAGDYLTLAPGATHPWNTWLTAAVKVKRVHFGIDDTGGWACPVGANDQFTITNSGASSITFILAVSGIST